MALTQHARLNRCTDRIAAICRPADVVLIGASEEQKQRLIDGGSGVNLWVWPPDTVT